VIEAAICKPALFKVSSLPVYEYQYWYKKPAFVNQRQKALEKPCIVKEEVPGDVIECGVWKGGVTIFMKAYLEVYQTKNRAVWIADSFEGVPKSTLAQDKYTDLSKEAYPGLAIPKEEVIRNFEKYEVPLENVKFLEGWFKDTLPHAPMEKLALLRLDGDLYESTMDVLQSLYHKLSTGGFVIIDDFRALPQCEEAVKDFRSEHAITEEIQMIDSEAAFWRKGN
jgi:hypothetical protein